MDYSYRATEIRVNMLLQQMQKPSKIKFVNMHHRANYAATALGEELDTTFSLKEIMKAQRRYEKL